MPRDHRRDQDSKRSYKSSKRRSSSRDSDHRIAEQNVRQWKHLSKPDPKANNKHKRSRSRDQHSDKSVRNKKKHDRSSRKKRRDSSSSSSSSNSTSSSSSSSAASDKSLKLLEKLKAERLKAAEAKRREKELIKATETPEEKRLRRLRKKEAKERKRKERMGWDSEYLHYTNSDNPFGDGNLLSTFVWNKKLAKEGLTHASVEEIEVRNRFKQEENKRELEKVKKRRLERELEKQRREEEVQLMQRSKEAAQFEEWERQEDQFHLEQARLRSHIRIQDGRAKPIDLLAKYCAQEEDDEVVDAIEMHEPYTYLNGLQIKDLEDLIEDIKVYKELERGKNLDYWNDITVIVEDELQKLRKLAKESEQYDIGGRREGIHQAVANDVTTVFKGKSASQLAALQNQIEAKINGKADGIDIGYWESLLSQLKAHMARARLRDRHQEILRHKLQLLKQQQAMIAESKDKPSTSTAEMSGSQSTDENEEEEGGNERVASDMLNECFDLYESGNYSPKLLASDAIEPGTLVITEEDDANRLEFARIQVKGSGGQKVDVITKEEQMMQREARKGMGDDEAQFSVESAIDGSQVYLWSDKYRPRKPRYFNRVHTGFEWNKYNQTHYDMDNPPPKIVQGYKFNIFYPDLIDKNATPEYFLTPCPENRDFSILRFHAGPPYEDIAFKIVNREWEYSYKRGFRCQFHNNIFQLWFHFKRYRYRR